MLPLTVKWEDYERMCGYSTKGDPLILDQSPNQTNNNMRYDYVSGTWYAIDQSINQPVNTHHNQPKYHQPSPLHSSPILHQLQQSASPSPYYAAKAREALQHSGSEYAPWTPDMSTALPMKARIEETRQVWSNSRLANWSISWSIGSASWYCMILSASRCDQFYITYSIFISLFNALHISRWHADLSVDLLWTRVCYSVDSATEKLLTTSRCMLSTFAMLLQCFSIGVSHRFVQFIWFSTQAVQPKWTCWLYVPK